MSESSENEKRIFEEALALSPEERRRHIMEACKGDDALRRSIEALFEAHEAAAGFMDSPLMSEALKSPSRPELTEAPGTMVGRYKLLQKLGEGGCGVVWMAEQEKPVRRRVALKIVKLGMDTREVIARFDAERQALAMMDHLNIAKIFDAGATESGRPYFVMELVRGIKVTEFCDQNNLSMSQRLVLFNQICHAVQHAHQKGIIHRDLKPSNILVTLHDGVPVPKVIDFGISKAVNGRLTDQTLFTAFQQFIGTPAYMSPEQAEMSGLDIDTRSDIYSLGVLLYELLTGRPPFDPKSLLQAGLDEIRRVIRDTEPPRPSKNLSTLGNADLVTVARQRGTDPSKLSVLLRGDLDWIVMRCLEKSRTRRYDTAAGLARDIRRYLEHEPVEARPPSTAYVLQKLVRRHKWIFISGGTIAVVLVSGIVASTLEAVRAERAEKVAAIERGRAESLLSFVLGDLHDQLARVGRLDVLESATDKAMEYFSSFESSALTDTELARQSKALNQIGEIRIAQANYTAATAAFSEAYERASTLSARHPGDGDLLFDRGQAEYWNGFVLVKRGELAKASDWMRRYYDTCAGLVLLDPTRNVWQSELAWGLHNLGAVSEETGDLESARSKFKEEMTVIKKLLAADPANADLLTRLADVHSWLGEIAEKQGDLSEASAQYEMQAQQYKQLADADPNTAGKRYYEANAIVFEARINMTSGHLAAAETLVDRAQVLLAQLVAHDPANVQWREASLWDSLTKAELALRRGGSAEARGLLNVVVPGLESVSAIEPTNRRFAALLSAAWRLRAEIDSRDGQPGAADAASHAISIGERLIQEGRALDADVGEFASAYVVAGDIADNDGNTSEARRDWQRATELLAPHIQGSRNWQLLDPAARAASHLGRTDEARAIVARLTLLGYVPANPWPGQEQPFARKSDNPQK